MSYSPTEERDRELSHLRRLLVEARQQNEALKAELLSLRGAYKTCPACGKSFVVP
jgi:hypothetical protein